MTLRNLVLLIFVFTIASCNKTTNDIAPPLVDGKYDEYEKLGVAPIVLSDDVDLYVYQNKHFVWLAYTYPDESFGTLDLEIDSDKLETPINLHVSAQLGEWEVGNETQQPTTSVSDLWWEFEGWTSNIVWPNGMDRSGDTPRMKYKNAACRELQISKDRFGRGTWKLKFNIGVIVGANGDRYSIDYPEDGSYYSLKVD